MVSKRHKRLSHEDALVRDLEIVRLKLSGMSGTAIAKKYRLTNGRVTQTLHNIARRIAPRKL
jgi:DNA-binding NarL/FixJ family response regulator